MYLQSPVNLFLSTYVYITHITSPYNTNFSPWLEKKKILRPPTTSFSSSRVSFTNCSSTNCPCLLSYYYSLRARGKEEEKKTKEGKNKYPILSLSPLLYLLVHRGRIAPHGSIVHFLPHFSHASSPLS